MFLRNTLNTNNTKTLEEILKYCVDAKAIDPVAFDLGKTGMANQYLIVSGRSDRHVIGITNRIIDEMKTNSKIKPLVVEGLPKAHWVLIDYDDVVVHVFYAPTREQYDLEALWKNHQEVNIAELIPDLEQVATA